MKKACVSTRAYTAAFTLTELLIGLLLLGVISTYTIPKVLAMQTDGRKKAIIREAVAALGEIVEIGRQTHEIAYGSFGTYVNSHINAVKVCRNNAYTEGCWDVSTQGDIPDEANQPGFVLPNGAVVLGVDDYCCELTPQEWCNGMVIDWNGTSGPNVIGEDQVKIEVNYGYVDGKTAWCDDNRRGTVNVEASQGDKIWGHSAS